MQTPSLVLAGLMGSAMLALAGCSSSPFGGGNPFKSASNLDVMFVNASQTWDLDKNGTIACDEWKQYTASEHRAADGNGDGMLDAQEWEKLSASDRLFETTGIGYFDLNGDGKVTADELANKPNPAFKMLDKNADCQIAHNEKATVYSNVTVKSKDSGGAPQGGPPPPGGR